MASSSFIPPFYISPATHHTHTIVALHGRGNQGPTFAAELFREKGHAGQTLQEAFPTCKWVFPSSQQRFSTHLQGELNEWFDIYSMNNPTTREELQMEGLHDSVEFVLKVLSEEARIVTPDRVILLGLSQGCAVGLLSLIASPMKIGAYVGLSGWMPLRAQIAECRKSEDLATLFNTIGLADTSSLMKEGEESVRATPIFLGHLKDDMVIDITLGRQARDLLLAKGMKVTWWDPGVGGGHWGLLKLWGVNGIIAFLDEIIRSN